MAEKNYLRETGIDEFYYAVIESDTDTSIATGEINRVKFLQNISIERPQSIQRAYGDNVTAQLAVSSGNVSVTGQFHKIPTEDKNTLFGLEVVEGLSSFGSDDNPPYVACVFAKTYDDGRTEWVGMSKGMFMKNNIEGQTKEDETAFTSDEVTAEFMDRFVDGFASHKSGISGEDVKGATVNRDLVFSKIFGKPYPGETVPAGV